LRQSGQQHAGQDQRKVGQKEEESRHAGRVGGRVGP
jgi:hypothetical protein